MSTYNNFKRAPKNKIGDIVLDTKNPGDDWIPIDDSLQSQAVYPSFYEIYGKQNQDIFTFPDFYTKFASTTTNTLFALAYGNNVYVYGGHGGVLATSKNGINWTTRTSGTTSTINSITYGSDKFVYVGENRACAYSSNGTTWIAATLPSSGGTPAWSSGSDPKSVAYGNDIFVTGGVGGILATSTNGISWTPRTSGTTSTIYEVIYGNGIFVYSTHNGGLATSTDGITWTAQTSGISQNITELMYGAGKYVYGSGRVIATSNDAISWTVTTNFLPLGESFAAMHYDSSCGVLLYGTNLGTIKKSTDAITWTTVTSNTSNQINNLNGNLYITANGDVGFANVYTYNVQTDFYYDVTPNSQLTNAITIKNTTAYIKAK